MRKILILVLCLFTLNINAQVDLMSTTPHNFVNDYEDIFSLSDEHMLNDMIKLYQDKTSIQISIVTTNQNFDSEAEIKDFADRLGDKWGVGSSELENGLMVLISVESRKWGIAVGYGLEPLYTDMMSKRIADRCFIINFRNENYTEGVKQFLSETMDEIGYEGYDQLIEKKVINDAEDAQRMKNFGISLLFIIGGGLVLFLIIFMVKIAVQRVKARKELSERIDFIHDDILLRKADLVQILKKVPTEIQKLYDDNVTNNNIKVDQDTLNRLLFVQSEIKDYQNIIYNTNRVISSILTEEREVAKYLKGNYEYCEEYLLEDLKSFAPDTKLELFTSVEFSVDRLNKLRGINNSLNSKLQKFLKKTYTISAIISASEGVNDKIDVLKGSYEKYKKGKMSLLTLPIGKRLSSLVKVNIVSYINNVKDEIDKSVLKLKENDYKGSSYHHGIYVTTLSVLSSTFSAVTNLISSYKRSDKYVDKYKNDYTKKIDKIEKKIKYSGVSYSRKNTLKKIHSKIKKFHNNIAFDVILSAILLKEILDELDDLYRDIKRDIQRKKDSDSAAAAAVIAAATARKRRNSISYGSSNGNNFGGFGGGGFGGGGSGGSW